jgi:hypothetical protein
MHILQFTSTKTIGHSMGCVKERNVELTVQAWCYGLCYTLSVKLNSPLDENANIQVEMATSALN